MLQEGRREATSLASVLRGCPRSCLQYRGLEFQSMMPLGASKEGIPDFTWRKSGRGSSGKGGKSTPLISWLSSSTPQRMRPGLEDCVWFILLTAQALQSPLICRSCSHPGPSRPVTVLTPRWNRRPVALGGRGCHGTSPVGSGEAWGVAVQPPPSVSSCVRPHVSEHRQQGLSAILGSAARGSSLLA